MAQKNGFNTTVIVLIVIFLVLLALVMGGCKLRCGASSIESYKRSTLGNDCFGLQRTPVDFAFKYPFGWQRNPHWQANPHDEHQPLDYGPIDFWQDRRRLDYNNGTLFQQYGNWWGGASCGNYTGFGGGCDGVYLSNDSKTRFNLTNVGDQGARVQLDDMPNPRFGPGKLQFNERTFDEVNPYFNKIYGGAGYLVHDKLGD